MNIGEKLAIALASGKLSPSDQSFGTDLLRGKYGFETRGFLTERQAMFAEKLYEKSQKEDTPNPKVKLDLSNVYAFLLKAKEHLKFPKIMLMLPGGKPLKIYISGQRSRVPNAVNLVTENDDGVLDKWLGRVLPTGEWEHREIEEELEVVTVKLMKRLNKNPQEVVAEHGRLHGYCAFCSRPLEDERSTEVGYGPVCAKKWSLPWG